ncbi:hypothetical protein [Kitasatospora sp. NPDC057015]|uniref:hypothetical protein n=1 Tax=Kitasatospora sp. NPDC057015 TaxID=3346001 RepID=UPI0036341C49
MPVPFITIGIEPSGAVTARGVDDDLTAGLLKIAGFQQIQDWYGRRHRLPSTTPPRERADRATHAATMLRTAGFTVDLDPDLDTDRLTTPTDPHGLRVIGQQVLRLTDHIRGASTGAQAADALDQLLAPEDGVIPRLREALEAAAEQVTDLDPDQHELSDRFSAATEWISNAESELEDAVVHLRAVGPAPELPAHSYQAQIAAFYSTAATSAARAVSPAVQALGLRADTTASTQLPAPKTPARPDGRTR